MFVVTSGGVVVADAPPSYSAALPAAIAEVTDLPVTHVIYSHAHTDHIGGATAVVTDSVEVIAHEATAVERADPNRPLRTITFEDNYSLEAGGRTIELVYSGTNHQEGNIFIQVPDADVMMLIDVIFPGGTPRQFLALAQDVPGFIEASNELLTCEWETLVSGHVTRADVQLQNEFVADLQAAAGTRWEPAASRTPSLRSPTTRRKTSGLGSSPMLSSAPSSHSASTR